MADAFERIERGALKRVIINMPPRSTKSKFASVLFPAWYLGKHPKKKMPRRRNLWVIDTSTGGAQVA